jgi:uncharacterized protein
MAAQFEVLKDADGHYCFRLKAANGEVVAESQNYGSVSDVRAGMAAVKAAAAEATVPDDDAQLEIQEGIHMHFRRE